MQFHVLEPQLVPAHNVRDGAVTEVGIVIQKVRAPRGATLLQCYDGDIGLEDQYRNDDEKVIVFGIVSSDLLNTLIEKVTPDA